MQSGSLESKTILLTVDVEDWFQVENFKKYISYSTWSSCELRVEKNTVDLLNILADGPAQTKATFFILGWIAERCPDLVREIQRRGHEVASHGYDHQLCYNQTSSDLLRDLIKSKDLLEDILGCEVSGYRAPSFSISEKALSLVRKAGYLYDSSYNSFEGHGRYGTLKLPNMTRQDPPLYSLSSSFYEIPVSNLRLGSKVFPWGGGGYFRLLPSLIYQAGVKHILKTNGCYIFYMHPWEIDPGQPRVRAARPMARFRHYVNLRKTKEKCRKFLAENAQHSFLTCKEFITKEQK